MKFNVECTYTVMPSPKDIEYIQELEHMKEIEYLQKQILAMENELSVLKLARDNMKEVHSPTPDPPSPPTSVHTFVKAEDEVSYHDYPSPVSMSSVQDIIKKRTRYRDHLFVQQEHDEAFPEQQGYLQHYLSQRHIDHHDADAMIAYEERLQAYKDLIDSCRNMRTVKVIAKSNDIEATVTQDQTTKPWKLTVKNGNMTIDTYITSHTELMTQMSGMLSSSIYQKKTSNIPFPLCDLVMPPKNAMGAVISVMIWRKYGKSKFKSLTKYTPTLMHSRRPNQITKVTYDNITNTSMRLISTYFQCLHLKMMFVHIPTFLRLFMQDEHQIIHSPVVMGLCAVICHQGCKHLEKVLPVNVLPDYALYYYEQARNLISERFDEASLETLLTYTYMAVYNVKVQNDAEGDKYLSLAERIYNILLPKYQFKNGEPESDEAILFARVYRSIFHLRSVIHLHDLMDNIFTVKQRTSPARMFRLIDNETELDIYISSTDSPKEVQFIKMRRYIKKLREAVKEGARCASSEDFPSYIGVFGHHVEMAMRHWYRTTLPPEFQLSLPLFEDNIPAIEFFTKLEVECCDSPIPILTTLDLYNEFLIMSKSYIPKYPDDACVTKDDLTIAYKSILYNRPLNKDEAERLDKGKGHHWVMVLKKLRMLKELGHHSFTAAELDEPDEQYFARFITAIDPAKINFDIPFIHTSIRTAFNMVRIVQFLLSKDYSCYLDLRWVLNAWEVLLRAARFKYQQPGDKEVTLDRIRANLILCLNILREEFDYSDRDPTGTFIEELEQKLNAIF